MVSFKEKIILVFIALVSGFLIFLSFNIGLFSGIENFFEDLLFSPKPVNPDIVIVAIDSDSISRIGQWPWTRGTFAKALEKLDKNPPRVLGLDVIFSEESRLGKADDAVLAQMLKKISYPVVLPIEAAPLVLDEKGFFQAENILSPLSIFLDSKKVSLGLVNLLLDKDGVARKFPLSASADGVEYRAFAYELLKRADINIAKENSLGIAPRIVYAAPSGSVRKIPFWRLLEEDVSAQLRDKIVFIGATAPDLHDEQLTPFSRGMAMPGVEIQANIANMLISGYRLAPLSKSWSGFWIFFAGLLSALPFIFSRRSLKPLLVNIGLGIVYFLIILWLFEKGIAANILHINFSWILSTSSLFAYRYWSGEKERREIKNLFSRYVNKEVLEEILKNPSRISLGGEEVQITILFSDIRGFTGISEKVSSKELVRILNDYFEVMSAEVLKHKGVLDKYIGDAIMAFWGAPIKDENQADNAVRAGLGMLEALKNLNQRLKAKGDPEINIGVGIYTGPAVVGNIGSKDRFDYTAIGDSVNVASRLEGLNKTYSTKIIIGESTREKLKNDFGLKLIGSVEVRGRKKPLNIYGL